MDLVDVIRTSSRRLLELAEVDLAAPIRQYEGWTMLDLLIHTGSMQGRTTEVIATGALEPVDRPFPPDESPATVVSWFGDGARRLADDLSAADLDAVVWGFGPTPSVGGWLLRMALETEVHRYDAEASVGDPAPIPSELASAGIDEFGLLWARRVDAAAPPISLAATDTGERWVMSSGKGGTTLRRSVEATECGVAGSASDLYLWLQSRVPTEALSVTGDVSGWDEALRGRPPAPR
jgi:uncharacterized protein (TIGR03083 family)